MILVVTGYSIRPATAADGVALTEALVEAASWDPLNPRPRVQVLDDPVRRRYIQGWPRPGDAGVLAVDEAGQAIGACWFRLFPADRPGFAGVSGVPELILGVRPVWRAQGVGRALLREVIALAHAAGHARLALSVERGNFAQRLYVSEGFTVTSSGPTSDVMIRATR